MKIFYKIIKKYLAKKNPIIIIVFMYKLNYKIKVLFFSISLLFSIHSVFGQQEKGDNGSIDINLSVVSNYVWRGHDFYRNYAIQQGKSYGSSSGAWAFQPSITWSTPVDGLYVNLFSSIALQGRNDIDIDKRLQKEPGGSFIQNRISLLDPNFDFINDLTTELAADSDGDGIPDYYKISDYQKAPNFYKEPVGLKRSDELDITIGYEKETKNVGVIGFGILHYAYANSLSRGTSYGTEVYITYAPPVLTSLKLGIYEDLEIHTTYYQLSYSGEYELTKGLTSSYTISAGYYVMDNVQGVSDITLNYTISKSITDNSSVYIGLNAAYCPDLKIQEYYWGSGDPITNEVNKTRLPIDLNGESTIYDGKVADPSKTIGPVNEYINAQISNLITNQLGIPYTYTPRQSLPRYLWWLSFGYQTTIE